MDGSIEPYQNTTEGAEIFFMCNEMFVPAEKMRAVCGANQRWSPDPADHRCTCECTYVHDVAMLIKTAVHIIIKLHITSFMQNWMICMYLKYFTYKMLSKLFYLWEDLIEVL